MVRWIPIDKANAFFFNSVSWVAAFSITIIKQSPSPIFTTNFFVPVAHHLQSSSCITHFTLTASLSSSAIQHDMLIFSSLVSPAPCILHLPWAWRSVSSGLCRLIYFILFSFISWRHRTSIFVFLLFLMSEHIPAPFRYLAILYSLSCCGFAIYHHRISMHCIITIEFCQSVYFTLFHYLLFGKYLPMHSLHM